jgi:hypothetical protein
MRVHGHYLVTGVEAVIAMLENRGSHMRIEAGGPMKNQTPKKEKVRMKRTFLKPWCPEEDSNLHSVATART